MSADLASLVDFIKKAENYIDVFGSDEDKFKSNYRKMARILHPDGYNALDRDIASEAFVLLQKYHDQATQAISLGTYGEPPTVTITTRKHTHEITRHIGVADVANIYHGTTDGENSFIKIGASNGVNDLMEQEMKAIKAIRDNGDIEKFHPYFPELLDHFRYNDAKANAFKRLDGFYTLKEVADEYGNDLNPLDAVWMWRRLLVAIGAAHESGFVHGAIIPEHVMIYPEQHGLVLVDWCFSREIGEKLIAVPKKGKYQFFYPEAALDKEPVDSGTDIYMAAKTMLRLVEYVAPTPFKAFLRGCSIDRAKMQPKKAFDLLHEFDELLERMGEPYHPRRFHKFKMPR